MSKKNVICLHIFFYDLKDRFKTIHLFKVQKLPIYLKLLKKHNKTYKQRQKTPLITDVFKSKAISVRIKINTTNLLIS